MDERGFLNQIIYIKYKRNQKSSVCNERRGKIADMITIEERRIDIRQRDAG